MLVERGNNTIKSMNKQLNANADEYEAVMQKYHDSNNDVVKMKKKMEEMEKECMENFNAKEELEL